jgi:hypothetical protein
MTLAPFLLRPDPRNRNGRTAPVPSPAKAQSIRHHLVETAGRAPIQITTMSWSHLRPRQPVNTNPLNLDLRLKFT